MARASSATAQMATPSHGGNVTSAGWQVTLCDPMWHVSSRSGVAALRTAIHLLLILVSYATGLKFATQCDFCSCTQVGTCSTAQETLNRKRGHKTNYYQLLCAHLQNVIR